MARAWQSREAEDRLGEVVDEAVLLGPQRVQGEATAVLMSSNEYRRLSLRGMRLSEFFRQSPLMGQDLDLSRDVSRVFPCHSQI